MRLLPDKYRHLGWLFFIVSHLLGTKRANIIERNENGVFLEEVGYNYFPEFTGEWRAYLASIVFISGLLFFAATKDKIHDEFIERLNYNSFIYSLIILGTVGFAFDFASDNNATFKITTVIIFLLIIYLLIRNCLKLINSLSVKST